MYAVLHLIQRILAPTHFCFSGVIGYPMEEIGEGR